MKLLKIQLRNFRRLENVEIGFEVEETVFVGPNNSGKTSATAAFRLFLITPDFKVHDFSVSKINDIDRYGNEPDAEEETIPSIEMDIWFSINPEIEFGRVFALLPNLSANFEEAGIRIKYKVKDAAKMKAEYLSAFPQVDGEAIQKSLSQYLSLESNLNRHFSLTYSALEITEDGLIESTLEPEEGKRVLRTLIRVDFVDAQRNIDDREASNRSNRLSTAFASYYKNNLKQAEVMEEANKVIDQNNQNLNIHYDEHFKDLMDVIQQLGVPSVNDRKMRIVSTISSEVALQGNTDLLYVDSDFEHELPEAYNGLGFKNLVYMAIQISHFHLQWINTEDKRPLCQIIFIEEPEAHLHAQVQQTFIANIWEIIKNASIAADEEHMIPQLGITTHSSHILNTVEFSKVRYFQRCLLDDERQGEVRTLNASKVLSLRDFKPNKPAANGDVEDEEVTLEFLKRYLKLTHCDLFFADTTIFVEGTVEKLLIPEMISKAAPRLSSNYLTILEVGGAYANRFASLMEFLGTPYLVITDLDSVDPADNRKVCRADKNGSITSNASIKFFLNIDSVSDLIELNNDQQALDNDICFIAFQKHSTVDGYDKTMIGRTFEETFTYENIQLFRNERISLGKPFLDNQEYEEEYQFVFETVKSSSFKKTEFALNIASSTADWIVPTYISDGLTWLEGIISPNADTEG